MKARMSMGARLAGMGTLVLVLAVGGCGSRRSQSTPPPPHEGTSTNACRDDEVPYYETGCEGPGQIRCWPAAVHPTPMEFCTCDGRTTSAPLPGGGIRWRSAGACPVSDAGGG